MHACMYAPPTSSHTHNSSPLPSQLAELALQVDRTIPCPPQRRRQQSSAGICGHSAALESHWRWAWHMRTPNMISQDSQRTSFHVLSSDMVMEEEGKSGRGGEGGNSSEVLFL